MVSEDFGDHSFYITEAPLHAVEIAKDISQETDHLIIAGGDGLINEVVNGLEHMPKIMILPIGSGNDLSRSLGLQKHSLKEIFSINRNNSKYKSIDVGVADIRKSNNELIRRKFISSSGLGLDAMIASLSNRKSVLRGLPLYLSSTFLALYRFNPGYAEVLLDGVLHSSEIKHLISIGNTKSSGGGFHLTPKAEIDDGLLDITMAQKFRKLKLLSILPKAISGKHILENGVTNTQFKNCQIKLANPTFMHTDGEIIGGDIVEVNYSIQKMKLDFLIKS